MAEKRERFIKLSRRSDTKWWAKALITLGAIVLAFLLCSFMILIVNPSAYADFYVYFYRGTMLNFGMILTNLKDSALLFLIAVALIPVFKMKYWNIGAEGQCLMGALGAFIGMLFIAPHLPIVLAILVEVLLAVAFAVVWTIIPAIFKALFNANETLFTLMMNYIATGIVAAFVMANSNSGSGTIVSPWENEHYGWLPQLPYFNDSYLVMIGIVLLVAAAIMVYMNYSKHGYELSVVGESQNTARYVGINVRKVVLRTAVLTGAICGIVGFLIVAGANHTISANAIAGNGFTAIIICWIGNFNVPLMAFYSILIKFVSVGCDNAIAWTSGAVVISGMKSISVALFFIVLIISTFFINFRVIVKWPKWMLKVFAFFKKVFGPVGNFFKKIGAAVTNFFKKIFKKKNKTEEEVNNG